LLAKDTNLRCALVIIADGFEEIEAIVFLSLLRQAGLCVKSVGLTSGLVGGAHGVWIMPDLTLADLDRLTNTTFINAVVLPEGEPSLAKLEADPRVHRLLRQIVAQRGQIVTTQDGLRVARAAAVWGNGQGEINSDPMMAVLWRKPEQSPEIFIRDLIRKLKQPPRA
jgi:DJ-1/PfpI family